MGEQFGKGSSMRSVFLGALSFLTLILSANAAPAKDPGSQCSKGSVVRGVMMQACSHLARTSPDGKRHTSIVFTNKTGVRLLIRVSHCTLMHETGTYSIPTLELELRPGQYDARSAAFPAIDVGSVRVACFMRVYRAAPLSRLNTSTR